MKLILLTLLGLAISAQGFRLPENGEESVQQQCLAKYAAELAAVKKALADELDACKSSSNIKQCSDAASAKAIKALAEISEKIRECVASGTATKFHLVEEYDYSNQTLNQLCIDRYSDVLEDITLTLKSEFEACKSSDNKEECEKAATDKADDLMAALFSKVVHCIKSGGNEFLNVALYGFSDGTIERECFFKYASELDPIREILLADLEECKKADDFEVCRKAAFAKASPAATIVNQKILDCIKEHKN